MSLNCRFFFRLPSARSIGILLALLIVPGFATAQAESRALTYGAVAVRDREATIAAHTGIVSVLSQVLKSDVRIIVDRENHALVEDFISGKVDIAYLGPLPFAIIQRNDPALEVLAAVNEESGRVEYRCVLVSAYDGSAHAGAVNGRLALTNPMSTCGYLSMAYILARHGVDIETLDYSFIGSHDQVALGVIRGAYAAGGMKDIVAATYQGLMLQILDSTPPLPGFVLVVNRNSFSSQEIALMRAALLQAKATDYAAWGVGNYGFSSAEHLDYELIDSLMTPVFRKLFMGGFHGH